MAMVLLLISDDDDNDDDGDDAAFEVCPGSCCRLEYILHASSAL